MIKKISTIFALVLTLALSSCRTPENVAYFQDIQDGATINPSQQLDIRIRPEDKLLILVSTQDPALSQMFNLLTVQNRLGRTTTTTTQIGSIDNSSNGQTAYYSVDPQGDINFPLLGRIHVAGMTRYQLVDFLEKKLVSENLVKDPIVTVEFANSGISVIGEVNHPGRFEFNKDRVTLLDAIAMAGDLTVNGMRENVIVMRPQADGTTKAYRVDLTDAAAMATSPVYYLQQDDVVYVEPNDRRKRDTTSSGNTLYTPSFWVSVGSLAVTIATLIVTINR